MKVRSAMVSKVKAPFNVESFLAKVGDGRSVGKYRKGQIVFSQGEAADAVFYIQNGRVKITVVSEQGKEAVVAILGVDDLSNKDLPGAEWQSAPLVGASRPAAGRCASWVFRLRKTGKT